MSNVGPVPLGRSLLPIVLPDSSSLVTTASPPERKRRSREEVVQAMRNPRSVATTAFMSSPGDTVSVAFGALGTGAGARTSLPLLASTTAQWSSFVGGIANIDLDQHASRFL